VVSGLQQLMESIKGRQNGGIHCYRNDGHLVYEGTYRILSAGQFRPGTTEYPLILKNWTHFDRGLPSREVPLTSVRMMAFLFGQSHEKVHLNQNQETPLVVLSNAHA